MVVLRSSLELHGPLVSSATDPLDLSNEFLSLEQIGRRRLRSARAAEQAAVTVAASGVSTAWGLGPGACGPAGLRAAGGGLAGWGPGVGGAVRVTVGGGGGRGKGEVGKSVVEDK